MSKINHNTYMYRTWPTEVKVMGDTLSPRYVVIQDCVWDGGVTWQLVCTQSCNNIGSILSADRGRLMHWNSLWFYGCTF